MVNIEYVKKRRKRIIAAVVSAVSSCGLIALIIIAFIGQLVGTFTVSLYNNDRSQIKLDVESSFPNGTTHLRVPSIPLMDVCATSDASYHSKVDNEDTSSFIGGVYTPEGELQYLQYFKYTFFIKNIGTVPVRYSYKLNVVENHPPGDVDYDLIDLLRVRIYENVEVDDHEYKTYMKQEVEDTKTAKPSYINGNIKAKADEMRYFIDETTLAYESYPYLAPNEIVRYTFCFWMDGDDKQCEGKHPETCSLKLGVDIVANETAKKN